MRKIKKWRYYCDHCKKVSGLPHVMRKHETGCTNNPGRVCGLCARAESVQQSLEVLISALGKGNAEGMKNVREISNDCPACILAAIRQSKRLDVSYEDEDGRYNPADPAYMDFKFKDEVKSFWDEIEREEYANHQLKPIYYPGNF